MKRALVIVATVLCLSSCSDEQWSCQTSAKEMFSFNSAGASGSASKGCSCSEIRVFELRTFGEVDEAALKSDFGC